MLLDKTLLNIAGYFSIQKSSPEAKKSCPHIPRHFSNKRVRKTHPSYRNAQLGPGVALNPNGFHTETVISTTGLWRSPSCAGCHGCSRKPALLRASGGLTVSPQALPKRWPQCDSAVNHGQAFLIQRGELRGKDWMFANTTAICHR